MDSQTLKWHSRGLKESAENSLNIYYGLQFSVSIGFPSVSMNGSPILVPTLGLFFFYWFVLFNFDVINFLLSYYALPLSLGSLFLL